MDLTCQRHLEAWEMWKKKHRKQQGHDKSIMSNSVRHSTTSQYVSMLPRFYKKYFKISNEDQALLLLCSPYAYSIEVP